MKNNVRSELAAARARWGNIAPAARSILRNLVEQHGFSVRYGDVLLLDSGWYPTHAGLLRLAARSQCVGIDVEPVAVGCEPALSRWVFRATVYRDQSSGKGFVGYGDADPSNVSDVVRGAELRIAETRAVNRALRKAYGIGLCSVEELGAFSGGPRPPAIPKQQTKPAAELVVVNGNGQPRLRDRLAQLIRQHRLDPELVKLYAADFCGTEKLRDAGRELVEDFINTLAEWARSDRDGLVCKLNSYAAPAEAEKESAA